MKHAVSEAHAAYLRRIRRDARTVVLSRIAVLSGVLLLWEVGADLRWFDPFILSSPSRVIATIARLYADGSLWLHVGTTLLETVLGFLLGTLLGALIAVLLWWMPKLNRVLDPYLVVLNALPKIALGPVLIVWIGAGTVLNGFLAATDEKQLLMRTLGATKLQIFTKVVLPAGVPDLISALKISVGMSWVGVIVGEYLVSKAGLGYLIVYGGQVFKLDLVMASVTVLCILAALMYYAVAFLEKKVRT